MLEDIFKEFCKYSDGKVKWAGKGKVPKREITALIFNFFDENLSQKKGLIKTSQYMLIDAIWRYPKPQFSDEGIQIVLEHEISKRRTIDFLNEEIQRMVDIKGRYKIGIFYPPSEPDEEKLKNGIEEKLKNSKSLSVPLEEYLFIFGRPTRQNGKNVILFKAFLYSYDSSDNRNLEIKRLEPVVIKQKHS